MVAGRFMPKRFAKRLPTPSVVAEAVSTPRRALSRFCALSSRNETNFSVPSMPYVSTSSSATVAPTSCRYDSTVAISDNQWQSVAISGNQWQSVAISGKQWQSVLGGAPHLQVRLEDHLDLLVVVQVSLWEIAICVLDEKEYARKVHGLHVFVRVEHLLQLLFERL